MIRADRPARLTLSGQQAIKGGSPAVPKSNLTVLERLMAKVVILPNGCWQWMGHLTEDGYGQISVGRIMMRTHRVSYEIHNCKIPAGIEIDHICHDPEKCKLGNQCPHRACVNPEHLAISTHKDNMHPSRAHNGARIASIASALKSSSKTHCKRGHEFTKENTIISNGLRSCWICHRLSMRAWFQAKKFGYI